MATNSVQSHWLGASTAFVEVSYVIFEIQEFSGAVATMSTDTTKKTQLINAYRKFG